MVGMDDYARLGMASDRVGLKGLQVERRIP